MKYLILALAILSVGKTTQAQTYPGFVDVKKGSYDDYDKRLTNAQNQAIRAIENFKKNPVSNYTTDSFVKETLDLMSSGLASAQIEKVSPEHLAQSNCAKESSPIMYTALKNVIIACPRASELSNDQLFEVMVHESYHVNERIKTGKSGEYVESEGGAMVYEYAVVKSTNSDGCIYLDSSYSHESGIKSFFAKYNVGVPNICSGITSSNQRAIAVR